MISVVIVTYQREQVLLDTLRFVVADVPTLAEREILVVDQTPEHEATTRAGLEALVDAGEITWIRLPAPSIPGAMNAGLLGAKGEVVVFLDDDVEFAPGLLDQHLRTIRQQRAAVVAGRVVQPWQNAEDALTASAQKNDPDEFDFNCTEAASVQRFIGCNFSVNRMAALAAGGFDENFTRVAYRYEAEFADRMLASGAKIVFDPLAMVHHLQSGAGGTRAHGQRLTTIKPAHTVGKYYYLFRAHEVRNRLAKILLLPFRSVVSRHHIRRPWWIPVTFVSELTGVALALVYFVRGRRLLAVHLDSAGGLDR